MSLVERVVELWVALLFPAFIVYGLIEAVAGALMRKDWQSASGAAGGELLLLSLFALVWFAANSKEPSLIPLGIGALAAFSGFWLTSTSGELEEKGWCWGCAALKHIRGAQYRCPISRALHPKFSELMQRATRKGWGIEELLSRAPGLGWPVEKLIKRARLDVQERRHVVPESTQELLRCDRCEGGGRRSFPCCNQRLCTDCFLDHARESREHEPPLPENTLAFAAIFNTNNLEEARLQKMIWLLSRHKPEDTALLEAVANIDNIKFTICQECDRTLRHFFVEGGKVLCADCFLDHCAEIENGSARPSSQP